MKQTPAHEIANPCLLEIIPKTSKRIIEIGCSHGALARDFKKITPKCHYTGIEIDASYAEIAKQYCDEVFIIDIENVDDDFWKRNQDKDCWIFGDSLEHLKNPWLILENIRRIIPTHGVITACIPNAQHWSLILRLSIGDFTYENSGLLDKTHIRWFTRQTIFRLFNEAGFNIIAGKPRIFEEPNREAFLPIIEDIAHFCGVDPKIVLADVLPLQYVIKAVPN